VFFGNDLSYMLLVMLPMGIIAITLHELAHGLAAYYLGDPTAKLAGRLTLNPIAHFDPLGTVMILLIGFGWAKPVPVNPGYLRRPGRDMMWVALAGPAVNLVLAIFFALLLKVALLLPSGIADGIARLLSFGVTINIILMAFNLIPVPPLDGSRVLAYLLPPDLSMRFQELERYGLIPVALVLFVLPMITGISIVGIISSWTIAIFNAVLF
jgi:Zn-dependent protease